MQTQTLRRLDGSIVCERCTIADNPLTRMKGLLGRDGLESDEGLLLRPASAVHTYFMRFPIDVVFLDADQIVVKIVPSLPAFRTASCRGAREVVELRAGESERRGLALGDRVAWAARAADEAAPVAVADLEGERRGAVVLASTDQRYVKLVRFLLDGKGIGVAASVPPQRAAEVASGESADVVVIDAGAVTEGLRLAHITRARRPEATVVLVGEDAGGMSPSGMHVYEKWDDTDGVVAAIEDAIQAKAV